MSNRSRVLFMGSKPLGLSVLKELLAIAPKSLLGVLTFDDQADYRSAFGAFNDLALSCSLPLNVARDRKHSEALIKQLKPDLCIVVGWYWLLGAPALNSVPGGFIGIHNSLLPHLRGVSPLVWSIINGESRAGFSIFTLSEEMDAGPIWAQGSVPIGANEYIGEVMVKLEAETLRTIRATYPGILSGTISPTEQNHALATYCAKRTPADGLIDWSRAAGEIFNFIRAQSDPYPGAFTWLDSRQLKIWRARVSPQPCSGAPGQVMEITGEGVIAACGGSTALVLEEVELEGRRGKAEEMLGIVRLQSKA